VIEAEHELDLAKAIGLVDQLIRRAKEGKETLPRAVKHMANLKRTSESDTSVVKPKTEGQREYLDVIRRHDMVFGLGPAGTGKTFLAVAEAVKALQQNKVSQLILTRPAVEAGERLGFLPGTAQEKVDPYLQPLFDSLIKLLGKSQVEAMRKKGTIELAPIAFMRGRTLENAFVLLDEAQNCTFEQLMMLITRLGEGSKCVVTGDASQVDLDRTRSGLVEMVHVLQDVEGIGTCFLTADDVVRHPLVTRIVTAVEKYQAEKPGARENPNLKREYPKSKKRDDYPPY